MRAPVLLTLVALVADAAPTRAENLVVSLSNHRVAVTSSFTGEEIVLFGTVEPEPGQREPRGPYDLVVTVSGPPDTLRTRRKERVLGIWVNMDGREFINVPSYLAILSNRPINDITRPEVLRRLQVGMDYFLLPQRIGPDIADTVRDDPFRAAFVRLEQNSGLYRQSASAVTFLTPTVFRANIPLPANAPTGTYAIDVKLFSRGEMVKRTDTALEVIKAGFEQVVADGARDRGLIYGIITSMMALVIGYLASVIFRRD